jgi:hypothetical protein
MNQASQIMKKSVRLAACLLALNLTPAFSQQPVPASEPRSSQGPPSEAAAAKANDLTQFNLDFPGGTPGELVRAIESAMRKPLNAIIDKEDEKVELPPLKMHDVRLPQLFAALEAASRKQVAILNPGSGGYSIHPSSYGFRSADHPSDNSVWTFSVEKPLMPPVVPPQRVCQYYSLSPYLDHGFTVEDITTAIQTGWKMTGATPLPELNYHKETGLLIAYGEQDKLSTINEVLRTLPTVKYEFWQRMNSQLTQLQQQVDELRKRVPAAPTNASPEEKSGK